METLDPKLHEILRNAVSLANMLDIEQLVMDSFSLRAQNQSNGSVIIMPTGDKLPLPFDAIGIGRVDVLKTRLGMLTDPKIQYDVNDKDAELQTVTKLKISGGKTTIGFKCHEPKLIKAPKSINDDVLHEIIMTEKELNTIIKGISVMGTERVNIMTTGDHEVVISIADDDGDSFTQKLEKPVHYVGDHEDTLSKTYKSKILRVILSYYIKNDERAELTVTITKRGVIKASMFGIDVYLFPER